MKMNNFIESSLRQEQKNQDLTDKEYDRIFQSIEQGIMTQEKRLIKKGFKVPKVLSDFAQVAAFIAILILVPVFTMSSKEKFNKASPNTLGTTQGQVDVSTKGRENSNEVNSKYIGKRIITSQTPFYNEFDKTKPTGKLLAVGSIVEVEKSEKDKGGLTWYYVVNPIDSSNSNSGWIPEEGSANMLSTTEIGDNGIKDSELMSLMEEYLKSLVGSLGEHGIAAYKVNTIKISSIGWAEIVSFTCEYDIKPYNTDIYSNELGIKEDKDGWLRGVYSVGEARILNLKLQKGETSILKNLCILTNLYSESNLRNLENSQPQEYKAAEAMLSEKGYVMLMNSGVGGDVTLPVKYSDMSKYDGTLPLYLEYCLQISKAQGLDFSKYNGKTLKLISGAAVKKEELSINFNYVFLAYKDEICGGWVEKPDYNSGAVKILTFDGRSFDNIVDDKMQWLKQKGLEVPQNDIEKALAGKDIDFKNPLIFKLMQTGDSKTADSTR